MPDWPHPAGSVGVRLSFVAAVPSRFIVIMFPIVAFRLMITLEAVQPLMRRLVMSRQPVSPTTTIHDVFVVPVDNHLHAPHVPAVSV